MAKRHKEWARRRRNLLLDILGNKCAHASSKCKGELTVDCIIPQGDKHHKMDTSARQSFYHDQLKKNNVQLLCEYHQGVKSRDEGGRNVKQGMLEDQEQPSVTNENPY